MRPIATITATNDSALSAKHTASLTTASSRPASAGPTTRAALTRKRVERDHVRQIGAILDEVHPQRLAQRHVERVDDAEPQREHDQVPDRDVAGPGEPREHDRLQQRQRLRDAQRVAAVDVVGDDAGERAEEQDAGVAAERDDARAATPSRKCGR